MNHVPRDGQGDRHVLTTLFDAAGAVERRIARAVEEHGLSLAKLGVLETLAEQGGALPLGRLADSLSCVRSNVTQIVDRLEADRLVRREPDPEDRRSTLAVLTDEGRRRCEEASRARDEAERQILGDMPAERRAQLEALLAQIGGASG